MGRGELVNFNAEPLGIIRAGQKDHQFISTVSRDVQDVVRSVFGQRISQQWKETITKVSTALYLSLTNLMGYQTLGEEYCGILMVDGNNGRRNIPNKLKLVALVILSACGSSILEIITAFVAKQREDGGLSNYTKIVKHFLPLLQQLHLALFYTQGLYYDFSKRVLGIQYLLVRRLFAPGRNGISMKYLMCISMINVLIRFLNGFESSRKLIQEQKESSSDELLDQDQSLTLNVSESSTKCTLCLDLRSHTSLTPCGHLFCFDCILDWIQSKPECPICREQLLPSRVTLLQNYS